MRIAYVCNDPGVPVFGRKGAAIHVQELLRAYLRLGHEVVLVAARVEGEPPPDLRVVDVVDVGRADTRDPSERELATLAVDQHIEARVRARPDIDLVHERYSLFGGGGIRGATGRPSLLEVNAPLIEEQATHRKLVHADLAAARLRDTVERSSAVVAVSRPVAGWVTERTGRVDGVHVVANGVDVRRIRPMYERSEDTAGDDPRFTVGFVGTLRAWHGVDLLVEALARLRGQVPGAHLLLVGDGPGAAPLLEDAARLGVPVEHTGLVDPSEVPGYLARMDVACAPYPDESAAYFSPLKVLEYLAAGVPVVASAVGQLPELLAGGRCGVLVPPGDPAALAGALVELAGDPARQHALARRGRRHVEDHHSWDDVARRSLAVTTSVLPPATVGARG
jgi:glycosyltransferase involved in cell wall biosynthesis